jgi:excisionase family DNA binding protein
MGKSISAEEAASRLGVDPTRVRVLLRQRRIKGARLIGARWHIPEHFTVTPGVAGRKPNGGKRKT